MYKEREGLVKSEEGVECEKEEREREKERERERGKTKVKLYSNECYNVLQKPSAPPLNHYIDTQTDSRV